MCTRSANALSPRERIRYDARRNEAARPQPDPYKSAASASLPRDTGAVGIYLDRNYLAQKIGGQPILIDLNAVQKLDYQNMIRIDFANAELVPTTILILFQLVDIVLSYGYIAYQLRVVRGEASGFGNLLDGFAITGRAIALTLLIDALVMVASAALLVPGLILSYAYAMASYLQVDHPDWSPVRCMRESRLMMRGHKWELFVLQLSFLGWQLLATIPGVSIFV